MSGPAGGIVGMVRTPNSAGFEKVIGFDMGGTSTDVSHLRRRFERDSRRQVAGVRLRAPMLAINTVAAGGGSICASTAAGTGGARLAGADPGPGLLRAAGRSR